MSHLAITEGSLHRFLKPLNHVHTEIDCYSDAVSNFLLGRISHQNGCTKDLRWFGFRLYFFSSSAKFESWLQAASAHACVESHWKSISSLYSY